MSRKTFVIDTNVLLQDPQAIEKFNGNDVVISIAVLEELDRRKKHTDALGENARLVLRYINDLSDQAHMGEGITVGEDVHFRIMNEPHNGERSKCPLPLDSTKNKILCAAWQLKEQGKQPILVSRDFVLRVKAESMGLVAQDYLSLKQNYDNLYRGLRKEQIPKSEIDAVFTQGFIEPKGEEYCPNEYAYFHCPENSKITCKFNPKSKKLEPLQERKKAIWGLHPLNEEQRCAMDLLMNDDIQLISFIGQAGTGKTLLALTCGLAKVFDESVYSRILISRPIMPLGKDIGFLPGTKEEKMAHWMQPIYDNLEFVCEFMSDSENAGETKKWIVESGKIETEAVTYIRGRSLSKTYIIIDEAQNLTPHEVKTIISRAGKGTKVILTGDPTQIDNPYLDKDSNALTYVVSKFKDYPIFGHITFEKTERSELSALAAHIL